MKALILLLLLPTIAIAGGGAMDGGGGNLHSEDAGAAWFLGSEPVRYCVRKADDFVGPENIKLQELAESVFSQWRKYIKDKRVNSASAWFSNSIENQDRTKLVFNTEYMDECNEFTDLTLYFGVKNKFISSLLGKHDRHLGLSYRTSYDPNKGRGKGFIWIRNSFELGSDIGPDWSQPERLRGILLHEVGHILGNGHSRGTIMDEEIANFIIKKNLDEEKELKLQRLLSQIDFGQELFFCRFCPLVYHADKNLRDEFRNWSVEPEPFKKYFNRLTGRNPVGKIQISTEISDDYHPVDRSTPYLFLILKDEIRENKIPIYLSTLNSDGEISRQSSEVRVFKRAILNHQSQKLSSHKFDKVGITEVGCIGSSHLISTDYLQGGSKGNPCYSKEYETVIIYRNMNGYRLGIKDYIPLDFNSSPVFTIMSLFHYFRSFY